jgi:hypothetical protein
VYNITMSSRIDKIKEIIEANKNSSVSPLDILKPGTEWAEESLSDQRFSICQGCPELIKLSKQCKKCGCFMAIKTKLQAATCPLGKW